MTCLSLRIKKPPIFGGAWGTVMVSVTGPCAIFPRLVQCWSSFWGLLLRGGHYVGGIGASTAFGEEKLPEGCIFFLKIAHSVELREIFQRKAPNLAVFLTGIGAFSVIGGAVCDCRPRHCCLRQNRRQAASQLSGVQGKARFCAGSRWRQRNVPGISARSPFPLW